MTQLISVTRQSQVYPWFCYNYWNSILVGRRISITQFVFFLFLSIKRGKCQPHQKSFLGADHQFYRQQILVCLNGPWTYLWPRCSRRMILMDAALPTCSHQFNKSPLIQCFERIHAIHFINWYDNEWVHLFKYLWSVQASVSAVFST